MLLVVSTRSTRKSSDRLICSHLLANDGKSSRWQVDKEREGRGAGGGEGHRQVVFQKIVPRGEEHGLDTCDASGAVTSFRICLA